jgi:4-amino-4-deoxy-L-arabinose transferase-like glycosyltransferase
MIGYLFAACWAGVYMGMFALAKTKLPSYITPTYPALAMIAAAYIVMWSRRPSYVSKWTPRLAFGALGVVGLAICIALPLVAREFLPDEMWLGVVGMVPLAAAAVGYTSAVQRRPAWSAASIGVCAVLLSALAFGWIAPRVSRYQPVTGILSRIAESSAHPRLAAHRSHEPSWVFYSRTPIPVIGHGDSQEVAEFLRDPDAFLITNERALEAIEPQLPSDVAIIARERFFLKNYDLIVLGRTRQGVEMAQAQRGNATLR